MDAIDIPSLNIYEEDSAEVKFHIALKGMK